MLRPSGGEKCRLGSGEQGAQPGLQAGVFLDKGEHFVASVLNLVFPAFQGGERGFAVMLDLEQVVDRAGAPGNPGIVMTFTNVFDFLEPVLAWLWKTANIQLTIDFKSITIRLKVNWKPVPRNALQRSDTRLTRARSGL